MHVARKIEFERTASRKLDLKANTCGGKPI